MKKLDMTNSIMNIKNYNYLQKKIIITCLCKIKENL